MYRPISVTWLSIVMKHRRIVIGNCTNTENDEDESHVSSKIKQNLTLTG
jgi:hypothetical protein